MKLIIYYDFRGHRRCRRAKIFNVNFFKIDLEYISNFIETYTVGVVSGLTVTILVLLFSHISGFLKNRKITKKYLGYIGKYYLYSYSSTGVDKIVISNLVIKSKYGKLVLKVKEGVYKYSGIMNITERNLYINYYGICHIEQVQLIFYSPLERRISQLVGVMSAISPIDEPISKYCILSNDEIDEKVVIEKFKELYLRNSDFLLKINKDNSLYFSNLSKDELKAYH